jgi:hypothetical protein
MQKQFIFTGILSLLVVIPAVAKQRDIHTLGSAPNVLRVELRNLDQFRVLQTGDPKSSGELHKVEVVLESRNGSISGSEQYHSLETPSVQLLNNSTHKLGGTGNLEIRKDDWITYGGRRVAPGTRNLWVHAKDMSNDVYSNGTPARNNDIAIRVNARELDCKGQRVCNRGDNGSFIIHFPLPRFTSPPPTSCGPSNTYRLTLVDDEIRLIGINGSTTGSYKKTGPILQPRNGELCIASTVAPRNANLKKNIDRTKASVTKEQRNKIIKKAFQ